MTPPKPRKSHRSAPNLLRGLTVLTLGLGAGGMLALSPDLAAPVVVLLLPGLVTLLADRSPNLGLARAMLLFQGAAAVGPVQRAFYACAGLHGCMTQICQPVTVLTVWLAAAAAWALSETVPVGLRLLEDARLRKRRTDLQARRAELVAEWGLDRPGPQIGPAEQRKA